MNQIETMVREICSRLGLPRPQHDVETLKRAKAHGFGELAAEIMRHMGLNCKLRLQYRALAKGTSASVRIGYVPPYGTKPFQRYQIQMSVDRHIRDHAPLETQALVLAHEFAHIVLASTIPNLVSDEKMTDITAVCMGYDGIWMHGMSALVVVPSAQYASDTPALRKMLIRILRIFWRDRPAIISGFGYLSHADAANVCRIVSNLRQR